MLIALTDSPAAPLTQISDCLLLAPARLPILSSSCVPGLAVVEALLSHPGHVERAKRLAASMAAYLSNQG